jgi:hypothetical protein
MFLMMHWSWLPVVRRGVPMYHGVDVMQGGSNAIVERQFLLRR